MTPRGGDPPLLSSRKTEGGAEVLHEADACGDSTELRKLFDT